MDLPKLLSIISAISFASCTLSKYFGRFQTCLGECGEGFWFFRRKLNREDSDELFSPPSSYAHRTIQIKNGGLFNDNENVQFKSKDSASSHMFKNQMSINEIPKLKISDFQRNHGPIISTITKAESSSSNSSSDINFQTLTESKISIQDLLDQSIMDQDRSLFRISHRDDTILTQIVEPLFQSPILFTSFSEKLNLVIFIQLLENADENLKAVTENIVRFFGGLEVSETGSIKTILELKNAASKLIEWAKHGSQLAIPDSYVGDLYGRKLLASLASVCLKISESIEAIYEGTCRFSIINEMECAKFLKIEENCLLANKLLLVTSSASNFEDEYTILLQNIKNQISNLGELNETKTEELFKTVVEPLKIVIETSMMPGDRSTEEQTIKMRIYNDLVKTVTKSSKMSIISMILKALDLTSDGMQWMRGVRSIWRFVLELSTTNEQPSSLTSYNACDDKIVFTTMLDRIESIIKDFDDSKKNIIEAYDIVNECESHLPLDIEQHQNFNLRIRSVLAPVQILVINMDFSPINAYLASKEFDGENREAQVLLSVEKSIKSHLNHLNTIMMNYSTGYA